ADTLRVRLGGQTRVAPRHRLTRNLEAYDAYLHARALRRRPPITEARQRGAAELFEEATRRDPTFAAAYAGLADALVGSSAYGYQPLTAVIDRARAAATRAVQLDSLSAEAVGALAIIAFRYDWRW